MEFFSNEFEMAMLQEAQYRGERFFRVAAEINAAEPMPFPRLYLLINNMELYANVIRIDPPLDVLKREKDFAVAMYVTTGREADSLRQALDVDGIKTLDIEEIPFGHIGYDLEAAAEPDEKEPAGAAEFPRYEREQRKSIFLHQDELDLYSFLAACLNARLTRPPRGKLIARALSILLRRQSGVSLGLVLEKAGEMANDVASRLGKMLDTEVRMRGDMMVTASVREAVNGMLTHLVRNAVDHGIETSGARIAAGKAPAGNVLVEADIKGGTYVIKVSDDGAGISGEEIRNAAGVEGDFKSPESSWVLEILTQPGFSTRQEASSVSGRGVGLDVVRNIVINHLGGSLALDSKQGKGAVFTISFSDTTIRYPAFPTRVGNRLLKAPKIMVEKIFPLRAEKAVSGNGFFFYAMDSANYPLYLFSSQQAPYDGIGILFRTVGEPFIVLADAVGGEKMYSLSDLIPSVSVLLARDCVV
jgi:hypothetical protein